MTVVALVVRLSVATILAVAATAKLVQPRRAASMVLLPGFLGDGFVPVAFIAGLAVTEIAVALIGLLCPLGKAADSVVILAFGSVLSVAGAVNVRRRRGCGCGLPMGDTVLRLLTRNLVLFGTFAGGAYVTPGFASVDAGAKLALAGLCAAAACALALVVFATESSAA